MLIDEAVSAGARRSAACEELGINERTYYRWQALNKEHQSYEDRRAFADHSNPANKLTAQERQTILDTVNEERFASMPPCQIVPVLADEGVYLASESTIYRILHVEKMQNHRGRAQAPGKYGKPTSYCATGPNQVWTCRHYKFYSVSGDWNDILRIYCVTNHFPIVIQKFIFSFV